MLSKLVGRSGEVEFNAVIDEAVNSSSDVTEHPVEDGVDVADHVKVKPDTVPISGVIAGDDAAQKLSVLRRFQREREVLTFIGRNLMENVVIENMSTNHGVGTRDGFEFSITLKRVRIAKMQEVNIVTPAASVSKTQVKGTTSKGIQQPKQVTPKQR